MRTPSFLVRSFLGSLVAVGLGAACGGGGKKPATEAGPAAPPADSPGGGRVMAPGTSGLPGLDWGADVPTVSARYSDVEPVDVGVAYTGAVEGLPGTITFTIDNTGLSRVDVAWTDTYPSMGSCGLALDDIRTAIDGRLGPAAVENMAAFWETATATVTLSCNPEDSGDEEATALTMHYEPRQPE